MVFGKFSIIFAVFIITASFMILFNTAYAQANATPCDTSAQVMPNPLNKSGLGKDLLGTKTSKCLSSSSVNSFLYSKFLGYAIKTIFRLAAGLAVLFLVYYAAMYFFAAKADISDKALSGIIFTIVGLIIMILARAIVSVVVNIQI